MTKTRNKAAQTATALLDFITRSPTPFQAVEQLSAELDAAGFEAVST
ncbi:MAG: aspartyl aminopeptidase, partial [Gammaproteobacteria bacterium]